MIEQIDGYSACESPLVLPSGSESLFGILSEPMSAPRGVGVVILTGGAYTPSISRNRFSVKLARRLAAAGFHALRFDYRGVGESTGAIDDYDLSRPFTRDVVSAADALRGRGVPSIILVGTCFGARAALSAVDRIPGIEGMTLMSMPLRDMAEGERAVSILAREEGLGGLLRRGFRWHVLLGVMKPSGRARYAPALRYAGKVLRRRLQGIGRNGTDPALDWVSPTVLESLRDAVQRQIPLLLLYGSEEDHFREFREAQQGEIGRLLTRAGVRVQVSILEGSVQGLTSISVQDTAMSRILQWLESRAQAPGGIDARRTQPR